MNEKPRETFLASPHSTLLLSIPPSLISPADSGQEEKRAPWCCLFKTVGKDTMDGELGHSGLVEEREPSIVGIGSTSSPHYDLIYDRSF
uniref:Uncharacterized protein n=1 Tax=Picea glauca TaxID=3330 RepID=A0A101LYV8_PICGL|nr:hypothetical protein ABT39_MTgene4885 [Picea glauca]